MKTLRSIFFVLDRADLRFRDELGFNASVAITKADLPSPLQAVWDGAVAAVHAGFIEGETLLSMVLEPGQPVVAAWETLPGENEGETIQSPTAWRNVIRCIISKKSPTRGNRSPLVTTEQLPADLRDGILAVWAWCESFIDTAYE